MKLAAAVVIYACFASPVLASSATYSGTISNPALDHSVFLPFYAGPFFDADRIYTMEIRVSRPAVFISGKLHAENAFGFYYDNGDGGTDFGGDEVDYSVEIASRTNSALAKGSFRLPRSFDDTFVDAGGVIRGSYVYNSLTPDYFDVAFDTSDPVNYNVTITASPVAEPATWLTLFAGFSIVGGTFRARSRAFARSNI